MMNERKSTYSQGASNCVEIGQEPGTIMVGDTKNPSGPRLAVRPVDWNKFVAQVKGIYGD